MHTLHKAVGLHGETIPEETGRFSGVVECFALMFAGAIEVAELSEQEKEGSLGGQEEATTETI